MTFGNGSVASIVDEGYARETSRFRFRASCAAPESRRQEGVTATYKDRFAPGIASVCSWFIARPVMSWVLTVRTEKAAGWRCRRFAMGPNWLGPILFEGSRAAACRLLDEFVASITSTADFVLAGTSGPGLATATR